MGRRSKLTQEQWFVIERRHFIGGEPIAKLAKEYSVDESAIRRRIKPDKSGMPSGGSKRKSLRTLAEEKFAAEQALENISEEIGALPMAQQLIVSDLVKSISIIRETLILAAVNSAETAQHLASIALHHAKQIQIGSDQNTNLTNLKFVMATAQTVNEAAKIPMAVMQSQKGAQPAEVAEDGTTAPSGLVDLMREALNIKAQRTAAAAMALQEAEAERGRPPRRIEMVEDWAVDHNAPVRCPDSW